MRNRAGLGAAASTAISGGGRGGRGARDTKRPSLLVEGRGLSRWDAWCLPFLSKVSKPPRGRRPDFRHPGATVTVAGLCRTRTGFATTRLFVLSGERTTGLSGRRERRPERDGTLPHAPMAGLRRSLLLAVALIVLAAACDATDRPSSRVATPATAGLVLLSGSEVADSLVFHDAAGARSELPVPDATAAWLSVSRRGAMIATLADGSLRLSTRLPLPADDEFAWRVVPSVDADLPEEPLFFATWAPSGLVTASIADDLHGRRSLAIVDPIGDATLILPLEPGALPAPPAWIDDDRVALPSGGATTVVNTQTGERVDGPSDVAQLSVSADGSRSAVARADGTVEIAVAAEWMAGAGQPEIAIQPGDATVGALALDRRGERLAIVWDRDGEPGLVTIYRRHGTSWIEAERFDLPGDADRGVPGWLP
jgi:hypothetical protein